MGKLSEMLGETIDNGESYQKMVASLKLALSMTGMHNLFVAVSDTRSQARLRLMDRLVQELIGQNSRFYEVSLERCQPDIVTAIRNRIDSPYFKQEQKAVFSIIGANELSLIDGGYEPPTPEERFFGFLQSSYLRWEHGHNREIETPNILWLNTDMLIKMKRKAPDYCAHVKDYFYFDF